MLFRLRPFWCWLFTGHCWDATSVALTSRGTVQKCHICGTCDTVVDPHAVEQLARRTRTTDRGGARTREEDTNE